jgi:hypothetical protein
VIFGLLLLLRGRAFDIVFGLIFGLSLMLFIQGNYLSLGAGSLAGDGLEMALPKAKVVINLIVWIVVVLLCVASMIFFNKFKDIVRLISTVALVALVGMTGISFAVISLSTDVYATEKTGYQGDTSIDNEVLTVKNLDTLATDKNIVVFVVDRFDRRYYVQAANDCPEIFDELDGFIYFSDYISLYPRTYPAVMHLMTGVEADFASDAYAKSDYMKNAFTDSAYMAALKEQDFDVNVYTDSFYGYENATYMREIVSRPLQKLMVASARSIGQSERMTRRLRLAVVASCRVLKRRARVAKRRSTHAPWSSSMDAGTSPLTPWHTSW